MEQEVALSYKNRKVYLQVKYENVKINDNSKKIDIVKKS
jgi:hypothetical protein